MLKFVKDEKRKNQKESQRTYTIFINRGYGMSMSNILDVLGGGVDPTKEDWIRVKRHHNRWEVIDDNMTDKKGNWVVDCTDLGFSGWDDEVENLDHSSDESQCFGMSSKLMWEDVVMEPTKFCAPSIERLCEALEHVAICSWCPGDI